MLSTYVNGPLARHIDLPGYDVTLEIRMVFNVRKHLWHKNLPCCHGCDHPDSRLLQTFQYSYHTTHRAVDVIMRMRSFCDE